MTSIQVEMADITSKLNLIKKYTILNQKRLIGHSEYICSNASIMAKYNKKNRVPKIERVEKVVKVGIAGMPADK